MTKTVFAVLLLVSVCSAQGPKKDYTNSDCECIPYFQCNIDGTMKTDGANIIDVRFGVVTPNSIRKDCGDYTKVCCLKEEYVPGNDVPPVGPPSTQQPPTGGSTQAPPTGPIPKPHVSKGCGYRNPNGISFRITGAVNNEAQFGEFPWMVAVLRGTKVGDETYQCGGSLIHPRVVLTGAHCVYGKPSNELTIRAGEWDTQTTDEALPYQDRKVLNIMLHPKYNNVNLQNDFGLLILETPVELADNVETTCLPEPNEIFDHSKCFATGWGKNDFGDKGKYQVILKAVELPAVPHDQCQNSLRKTRLGKHFLLNQSFMCAGGVGDVDTCKGDGGSPLVCPLPNDPNRYSQAGIVSWGIGCGTNGVPGVYGDVSTARQWIDETLASFNIDSSSYTPAAEPTTTVTPPEVTTEPPKGIDVEIDGCQCFCPIDPRLDGATNKCSKSL